MNCGLALLLGGFALAAQLAAAQGVTMAMPEKIEAGASFSLQTTGGGKATLYIVGPPQVLKREIQLGATTFFAEGTLPNAGHYAVFLATESSTQSASLDIVPESKPATLDFLAKPSRIQVNLHDGITGAIYVFDVFHNLITFPLPVSFELSSPSGAVQKRNAVIREGASWTAMDSTAQQGMDRFVVRMAAISTVRVVAQVPGDPCRLQMSARLASGQLHLATEPVRDCSGNAVPDGTVVTFTETYQGGQSTVDVPLKQGIAEVQMPAQSGAMISVASGLVLGNQIRWEK